MIDIPDEDIVLERRDSSGRFALFTNTDLPQSCPLPWWSVMLDHGGDASAILLRVDENYGPDEAWTARDITRVALARLQAESNRRSSPLTTSSLWHVERALSRLNDRPGLPPACPLSFHTGIEPSPYPWTSVQRDDTGDHLDLCPDPSGTNEGISAELLLVVLNQLLQDSSRSLPKESLLALANAHIEQALLRETRRATSMRACTRP